MEPRTGESDGAETNAYKENPLVHEVLVYHHLKGSIAFGLGFGIASTSTTGVPPTP